MSVMMAGTYTARLEQFSECFHCFDIKGYSPISHKYTCVACAVAGLDGKVEILRSVGVHG